MSLLKLKASSSASVKYRALTLTFALIIMSLFLVDCNKGGTATAPAKKEPVKSAANAPNNTVPDPGNESQAADAKAAMDILLEGNTRYVSGNLKPHDFSKAKLEELAKGQHPHAIVLTCSDSRVAPELLFDQSLGDIFVVRTAGNVLDKASMGSIEYAAEHLHAPLIMVVGHEKCGAVTAATKDEPAGGNIQYVVNEIKPAVAKARKLGGDLVAKSIDENVKLVVENMPGRSQILTDLIRENKIKIVGASYSISTGKVEVISDLANSPTIEEKEGKKAETKAGQ